MAISSSLRALVLERDKFRCWFCGATSQQTQLQVDHIIPQARGGTDTLDNLATLCQKCNRGKSDNYFGNYMRLVISGSLPRQPYRSALYPPVDYQLDALRQLIPQVRGHKQLTLSNFARVIQTGGLRDRINPLYEPLSFATITEGFEALVASGELLVKDSVITFPSS